jgi:hypothetical protein
MLTSRGVQTFGANPYLSGFPQTGASNFNQTNRIRNLTAGQGGITTKVGYPSGYLNPGSWMFPQKAGTIAARNTIAGAGALTATAQAGRNLAATITGSGGIPPCDIGLIIAIAATLTGSGGISSAATQALASLVATLTGSSSVTATAAGLAALGATLTGAGVIVANNTALADIAAEIRGYGDLTPEGIRDAVWNAILANYPTSGTAGNTLALAGSGGVDYTALGIAVWTSVTRTLTSGSGPSAADIVAAIEAAIVPVNVVEVVDIPITGTGTEADPWGPP